jgi:hypothetical protein
VVPAESSADGFSCSRRLSLLSGRISTYRPVQISATGSAAALKLVEIANAVEPVQDGRIHIEKINWPFLSVFKGSPTEYGAGLKLTIERGWLWLHESGTYVKFTPAGAELFA